MNIVTSDLYNTVDHAAALLAREGVMLPQYQNELGLISQQSAKHQQ